MTDTNSITIIDLVGSQRVLKELGKKLKADPAGFHIFCRETVIKPRMSIINRVSGQENDAAYMAYVVENWLNQNP